MSGIDEFFPIPWLPMSEVMKNRQLQNIEISIDSSRPWEKDYAATVILEYNDMTVTLHLSNADDIDNVQKSFNAAGEISFRLHGKELEEGNDFTVVMKQASSPDKL